MRKRQMDLTPAQHLRNLDRREYFDLPRISELIEKPQQIKKDRGDLRCPFEFHFTNGRVRLIKD